MQAHHLSTVRTLVPVQHNSLEMQALKLLTGMRSLRPISIRCIIQSLWRLTSGRIATESRIGPPLIASTRVYQADCWRRVVARRRWRRVNKKDTFLVGRGESLGRAAGGSLNKARFVLVAVRVEACCNGGAPCRRSWRGRGSRWRQGRSPTWPRRRAQPRPGPTTTQRRPNMSNIHLRALITRLFSFDRG